MWRWLVVVSAGCGRLDFDSVDATYRDAVLADRPAVYLRLADTGAIALDETGHVDAMYGGSACEHQVPGALVNDANTATRFNYTCVVDLGTGLEFDGNAPYSIELWWNPENATLTSHYLVMRETRMAGQPVDGYGMIAGDTGFYFERCIGGANRPTTPIPIASTTGFAHYVGVYDGATVFAYIDGVLVGMKADARVMAPYSASGTVGGYLPNQGKVPGTVDEVAIYDHALTPERIALHHELGVNGPR